MPIQNVSQLIIELRAYEPSLIDLIMDYIFWPCETTRIENRKYKYIKAKPLAGTRHLGGYAFKLTTMNIYFLLVKNSII